MSGRQADLLLTNARVLTCDPARSAASAVALAGDRIVWVGESDDAESFRSAATRVVDCQGKTLLPGLIDAHMHLFAYGANLLAVDCSPRAVRSVSEIQAALARRAAEQAPGQWVRGWGYDEFSLAEGRHPHRSDLDAAVPHHPVRLIHRSGHASVLNGAAMDRLGIGSETPEPPGGMIDRDTATGELTGYFLEMEDRLASMGTPTLTGEEMERGLELACRRLLGLGVTSIHEATPSNAMAQWDRMHSMKRRGRLPVRVHKMFGPDDLKELEARELFFGAGEPGLNVGAVKIMLNETGETVLPEPDVLNDRVYAAHQAGYQVAFHAVEERGIEAALGAVEAALHRSAAEASSIAALGIRLQDHRHRIEHCGVCPPELARRIRALGMVVVTQPGFIAEHGQRYLAQVPEAKQRWLYPVGTLMKAGVSVAFGSDCPVAPPGPLAAIGAAMTRRAGDGRLVGPDESISLLDAVAMHTAAGAYAASDEHDRGTIAAGRLADLVLLESDLSAESPEAVHDVGVEWTMIGGAIAWER